MTSPIPDSRVPWAVPPDRRAHGPMPSHAVPCVDIVIPVHNEEHDLEGCVLRLYAHLRSAFPYSFRITIADNASTDLTWEIGCRLSQRIPEVRMVRIAEKGRGRALRQVWSASDATVLAYMDVDLSTDLAALLPLLAPLLSGHSDVAIGTRLARGSRVSRGARREAISRAYNLIVRTFLGARFSDAQCGFKAIRAEAAAQLLPHVQDPEWFFDTELLVLAQRAGMRIHEVPVDWVDDPHSSVDLLDTARKDLAGVWRMLRGAGTPGQVGRFVVVGVLSTLGFGVLFWIARGWLGAQAANVVALLLTAVANTAANRSFTFGVRGRADRMRHQLQGLVVFGLGLAVTSGSLALLAGLAPQATRPTQLMVLTLANFVATVLRFALFRSWVFRPQRPGPAHPDQRPSPEASGRATTPALVDHDPREKVLT